MKVYLSCTRFGRDDWTGYHLHVESPKWKPDSSASGGGLWWSRGMYLFCEDAIKMLFGDQTPAVGELLELDIRPGKTWVWK